MNTMLDSRMVAARIRRPEALAQGAAATPTQSRPPHTVAEDVGHESGNYGPERKPVKWTAVGSGLRLPVPAVT